MSLTADSRSRLRRKLRSFPIRTGARNSTSDCINVVMIQFPKMLPSKLSYSGDLFLMVIANWSSRSSNKKDTGIIVRFEFAQGHIMQARKKNVAGLLKIPMPQHEAGSRYAGDSFPVMAKIKKNGMRRAFALQSDSHNCSYTPHHFIF